MSESSILGAANATLHATSPPHFGRLAPTVFYAQGYSGHGMAITGIAGLAIAEAIMGDDGRLKPFEQLRHSNIITPAFPA